MAGKVSGSSKWTDFAFKVLSVLVVPLLGWGVRLEVKVAVQDEKTTVLDQKITKLEAQVAASASLNVAMGHVEEKIDATNKRLDEIKMDLRRNLPPGP